MNNNFPRILTLLRKERGISQKQAAAELDVSQALLSHYEKGIRECGLDFVVRTSEFYNVSCDYLLGCSPERTGAKLSVDDIPEDGILGKENTLKGSILPTLNKKLLINSLNVVFDILQTINDKEMTSKASTFLNLAVYRIFRTLYSINPKNEQALFTVPAEYAPAMAMAEMTVSEAVILAKARELKASDQALLDKLYFTTQTLSKDYPLFCTSLLNLIKNSENKIDETTKHASAPKPPAAKQATPKSGSNPKQNNK